MPFLPKISSEALEEMVRVFMTFAAMHLEVAVCLFFTRAGKYEVFVPAQTVTEVSCAIEYDERFEAEAGAKILAGDFHSHHFMAPEFSRVDDEDEVGSRLYGVFGLGPRGGWRMNLRAGSAGMFIPLIPSDFIDGCGRELDVRAGSPSDYPMVRY